MQPRPHVRRSWTIWFQSSPVPEDGCNDAVSANIHVRRYGFNPHPSRRTGATYPLGIALSAASGFNPHPSRRTGATLWSDNIWIGFVVSILTRPGGRVQRERKRRLFAHIPFQSSPVPEDGCNVLTLLQQHGWKVVSILTRPGGRVQRHRACAKSPSAPRFNPHPSRRTGAT